MEDAMSDQALREHVVNLLTREMAHAGFDAAVKDFPIDRINERLGGVEYSAWDLVYHLRFSQWDMLDFSRNPGYREVEWPKAYWPDPEKEAGGAEWDEELTAFRRDLAEMVALVEKPDTDLFAKIPHGSGQTILREALLIADHNSHHVGQLILMRKLMGVWGAWTPA
jgi:hypothetical protein